MKFFFRLISSEECSNFTVEKWAYLFNIWNSSTYVEDERVFFYTAPKKSRWLVPTKNWEERTSCVRNSSRLGVVVIILVDVAMLEVPNRTLEQAKVRRWCWACQCIVSLTFDICFSSTKQVVENCCILLNKCFAVVFNT